MLSTSREIESGSLWLTLQPPEAAVYLKAPTGQIYPFRDYCFDMAKNVLFHCIVPLSLQCLES